MDKHAHDNLSREIAEIQRWFDTPRFRGITRLYTARQVAEQRGSIGQSYPVAAAAAAAFDERLRELFGKKMQITTFGPYSPGQAVAIKRMGIEGIYLGGWATSAKGSLTEDPGPDLASYPLSQVPDEAASLVRALLSADKNQRYARSRMSPEELAATPEVDYRPFIIADADTGHGGEAHVRNLVRRFVEAGVPGYHIEDQKPGVKKCGHQAGKVLVSSDEQIKRLNSARFQLDIMGVPGIIVARTDAEAATFIDMRGDERDHPFLLGATDPDLPSYKSAYLAVIRKFYDAGIGELNGHLLYRISEAAYLSAFAWLARAGLNTLIDGQIAAAKRSMSSDGGNIDGVGKALDAVINRFLDVWQMEAGLKTYGEAVTDAMKAGIDEGTEWEMTVAQWREFARSASLEEAREKAATMGVRISWDCDLARTPEGYYQVRGGIDYAIAKSLAVAPFSDLIWMETKTANLDDAREFAGAIHASFPDKMLAYNLSPSFNWDTTGMSDDEMKKFPEELGRLGYVFNFITYGGHQIDGLAGEEFSTALKEDGMLALARLQRKFRLLNSPYKTPQTHVGGPRSDAALMASTGRTATTKAMGKGSTQYQHLVQTEVPPKVLEDWLRAWSKYNGIPAGLRVRLRPHTAGSDLLSLNVMDESGKVIADVIFTPIQDRRNRTFLSIRDQNNFRKEYRQKRLMTLMNVFLIHRYRAVSVHYVTPTEDNLRQAEGTKTLGIYSQVNTEVGDIIVATVDGKYMKALLGKDGATLKKLIEKEG
ncbi:MAG TPA: isocitrate lyase ICL2 [Bacteroidota bacterium]|nr:isocitrate lyase ICL2 [Bacteroidota bacterium]